ncbi:FitA-like ribbon-helix-helix domain-containing protein [Roseomonas sp. AR75]|jgi:plasmid stability protein|uniref:FitA-like ribbon-helix-helix domain-containing protein n=1 Tax=Roseomonas sp. AR75 TaxID=2562311 RepID=UPI0010C10A55|nr:Arc family DNA-binding protein [Roseomonas sp. AR75]
MPQLLVRNVDEETIARLKARAAANGRSMEAELRDVIRTALSAPSLDDRWEEFERLAALSRAMTVERPAGAATAEELLRESRDER